MDFKSFNVLLQKNIKKITKNVDKLFTVDVDKDILWNTYLDSFPEGTNEIFRERREFDCSCCRQFIKNFGNVVTIENGVVHSIWDFKASDARFQPVIDALSELVKSSKIQNVLVTRESKFGTQYSREMTPEGTVITWDHFFAEIDSKFVYAGRKDTVGTVLGDYRTTREVFERSLTDISKDSIETVLDLISQNSLYKGNEWKSQLKTLLKLNKQYAKLSSDKERDLFCWTKSVEIGPAIARIKNHSIGVLLQDISANSDLDQAVKRYENIVAPSNYKRPKAIFTKKMIEDAERLLTEEGFIESLPRRFAVLGDITVNNILYANRDAVKKMSNSVFDDLKKEADTKPKKLGKTEEVSADKFFKEILPGASSLEVLVENRHVPNLVSLIAPKNPDSKSLFKWGNNFSWAYNGNITDSMKERVKSAGGKVDGVLRFSIQWNENGDNRNDFDAHCKEPKGNLIHYARKQNVNTGGNLDVDIIDPGNNTAVENITWPNLSKMEEGNYEFMVHNFSDRGGTSGFRAEIEFDGQIHSFSYEKAIRNHAKVHVATVKYRKSKGFEIVSSLPSSMQSKTVWGLKTNKFHPASVCMFSPNYWDEKTGIGNKHYFFMLNGCANDGTPNGFFNEFLREDTMKHKRVFEALGSKMKVKDSEDQLSGLGFSDTQRNSVTVRVTGSFTRTLVVNF